MTKDQAEEIVLARWRRRPEFRRQSISDASAFLIECRDIVFDTLGNREHIIFAWLVRELQRDGWLDLTPAPRLSREERPGRSGTSKDGW